MTLQPIKDVAEYKRLKLTLRDRFESEETGDQTLLEEQTKNINHFYHRRKNFPRPCRIFLIRWWKVRMKVKQHYNLYYPCCRIYRERKSLPHVNYHHYRHMYYRQLSLHHSTPLLNQPSQNQ